MINRIIIYIMVISMAFSAIDRMFGNKMGYGKKFEDGFYAMGTLALGMGGVMVSSNLIGKAITSSIGVFFKIFNADPCMAGSLFLSIDTGGYTLAHQLQPFNNDIANYSSIILGSMMGPTIAFNIPVCLGMIDPADRKYMALGTMSGIICIPFACLIGGIVAGFDLKMIFVNILPVILFSCLLAVGLSLFPGGMMSGFAKFAKIILIYLSFFLALSIIQELTPVHVITLEPLSDVWNTIGRIAIILAGAYPLVHFLTDKFSKSLNRLGKKIGINSFSVTGLLACLANSVPSFALLKDMNDKGKVINVAFACCASFALGDHLGFCASFEPDMILPMVAAKLTGGILSILCASFFCKRYHIT